VKNQRSIPRIEGNVEGLSTMSSTHGKGQCSFTQFRPLQKTYMCSQLHAQAATIKYHTSLPTLGPEAHEILHFFWSYSSCTRICAFVRVQCVTEENRRLYAVPSISENIFILLTNFNFPKMLLSYWSHIIKSIFDLIFGIVSESKTIIRFYFL